MIPSAENEDVTYNISGHDLAILKSLYVCFDRPAFRMRFEHESDLDALIQALDDTIAAINTGVKKTRDGIVFGEPSVGKAYLENLDLRAAFDGIVETLSAAKFL